MTESQLVIKAADPAVLDEVEIPWRELQSWLEESGYALRPRYHPAWTPSWLKTGEPWHRVEDSHVFLVSQAKLTSMSGEYADRYRFSSETAWTRHESPTASSY